MVADRDETKLRELIVYVAQHTADDTACGAVKFNKILYHADFAAYLELGHSISGAEYLALELGPGPRRLKPVRNALVSEGAIRLDEAPTGPYVQTRIVALRDADVGVFGDGELAIVDRVIAELRLLGWRALSDATHETPGYKTTAVGSVIPYETAFVSNDVTAADRDAALAAAARFAH